MTIMFCTHPFGTFHGSEHTRQANSCPELQHAFALDVEFTRTNRIGEVHCCVPYMIVVQSVRGRARALRTVLWRLCWHFEYERLTRSEWGNVSERLVT